MKTHLRNQTPLDARFKNERQKMATAALLVAVTQASIAAFADVSELTYLKPAEPKVNLGFGDMIAMSGNVAIVATENAESFRGRAYILEASSEGSDWRRTVTLAADPQNDGGNFDFDAFGSSVAISGSTIVVGCPGDDSNGDPADISLSASGADYVFVRVGENWQQQAYLKASEPVFNAAFGSAVAIADDILAVGTGEFYEVDGVERRGRVHMFQRKDSEWAQIQVLDSPYPDSGTQFAKTLALEGDTLVVGVPSDGSDARGIGGDPANANAVRSGAVWIYHNVDGNWMQEAYIKASNAHSRADFGASIAISENRIVVGSPTEKSRGVGVNGDESPDEISPLDYGAAYVFIRTETGWQQQAYLKAPEHNHVTGTFTDDRFGASVAISANTVLIGADADDNPSRGINGDLNGVGAIESGAAHLFRFTPDSGWAYSDFIKASNADRQDGFGRAVAMSGAYALVGAPGESSGSNFITPEDNSIQSAGAIYVYSVGSSGVEVIPEGKLKIETIAFRSTALDGNIAVSATISGPPNSEIVVEGSHDLIGEERWKEITMTITDESGRGSVEGSIEAATGQFYVRLRVE
ncbi:MAG: FG-GAP repeat protein [Verrucomicrobiales bacterium]